MIFDSPYNNRHSPIKMEIHRHNNGTYHRTVFRNGIPILRDEHYRMICFDAARQLCLYLGARAKTQNAENSFTAMISMIFYHLPPKYAVEPMNFVEGPHDGTPRSAGRFDEGWRETVETDRLLECLFLTDCDFRIIHDASREAFHAMSAAYIASGVAKYQNASSNGDSLL